MVIENDTVILENILEELREIKENKWELMIIIKEMIEKNLKRWDIPENYIRRELEEREGRNREKLIKELRIQTDKEIKELNKLLTAEIRQVIEEIWERKVKEKIKQLNEVKDMMIELTEKNIARKVENINEAIEDLGNLTERSVNQSIKNLEESMTELKTESMEQKKNK